MQVLRQSTSVVVRIGVAVAVGDGFTPVTTLALSTADEAELLKAAGAATVDISGATFAAITGADGWYDLTLSATDTNTVGTLDVVVNDDSLILPIFARFQVIEEAAYDAIYAASAPGPLAANDNGSGLTEAGGTGDQLTALATQASVNTIDGNVDAILVDTGTTLPATLSTIDGVVDDILLDTAEIGVAGAGLTALASAADLATVDGNVDLILADTAELQADWTNGGRLDLLIDGIKAKTDSLTFTVAGVVDGNVQRINDVAIVGDGSGTPFDV